MNKLTQILLVAILCLTSVSVKAQDRDDSRYLAGAVPVVDGKVVFSKEFSIPGMSKEKIFSRMNAWLNENLKKNNNENSRVVFTDEEKGIIAGVGEEWMVFKAMALMLDRTLINYQVTINCKPEKCTVELEKIKYTYQENEKYVAEEWITDQYALNKAKTKMVRGLAKWRIKTVDFADALFAEAAQALGAPENKPAAEKPVVKQTPATANSPVVISTATTGTPATATTPVIVGSEMPGYKSVAPADVPKDAIQQGKGKVVIVIGKDAFNMSMMTADAGGSLSTMSGKPVILCYLAPEQPYEQMAKAETYTIRYYPAGQSEPSVILECKKMPSQGVEGQPHAYVGEILKAWMK